MTPRSSTLAPRIEQYLLAAPRWVKAAEIVRIFGLASDRTLRADNGEPGMLASFAISSSGHGFKHLAHCTDLEFEDAYKRMRGHGLGELVNARQLRRARERYLVRGKPVFERSTGQALLFCEPATPNPADS